MTLPQRKAYPKRSAPPKRKRATPRRSERVHDRLFLDFVRGLPCAMAALGRCYGRTEADHVGPRPLGRKADDDSAVPLCSRCHASRHALSGVFSGWTREALTAWCEYQINKTRASYARWLEAGTDLPF